MQQHFEEIEIKQNKTNYNDITIDAGNNITVACDVKLPEGVIEKENIEVQAFFMVRLQIRE